MWLVVVRENMYKNQTINTNSAYTDIIFPEWKLTAGYQPQSQVGGHWHDQQW